MSSLRNAVQRRPHRERAQPLERRRLGLLEKHKDYLLRAKDFNKKKEKLKALRQKAAERNDDEFYFGMMSRKGPGSRIQNGRSWSGTVEGDRGNKSYDMETIRLLKTQDLGYIRTMRQVTANELAKLEEQVVLTRGFDHLDDDDEDDGDDFDEDDSDDDRLAMPVKPKPTRKIMFMDDEEERDEAMDEQEQQEQEMTRENDEEGDDGDEMGDEKFERAKSLRRLQRQLEQAKKRLKALTNAELELDVQRAKMAKTATSGGETRRGKKIMVRKRKR